MVGHFPLEGDGCVTALFHYIWSKNQVKKSCPLVNVPDTVVYKYRQPAYWYFTSKDPAGGIKMKNKANLGNVKVEEALCNKPNGSNNEVVAYYISSEQTQQGLVTTIEHFDSNGLRDFLYNHEKENNGILQRFVDSKGYGNTLFRAIWSPNVFHVERRGNKLDVADKKYNMHQRVVTFEGEEHFSNPLTVTDTLLGSQMQRICESMVEHCTFHLHAQGDNSHISRMVLYFKMDDRNRIWFLWCSSIRTSSDDPTQSNALRDMTPIDIHTQLSVPEATKRHLGPRAVSEASSRATSAGRRAEFVCGPCTIVHGEQCAKVVDASRKCEITYKMVIEYYEQHKADVPGGPEDVPWMPPEEEILAVDEPLEGESSASPWQGTRGQTPGGMGIPAVFRKLHPNMSPANYFQLKKDPLFLYSRMAVCDHCYLLFTEQHAPKLPVVDRMPSSLLMERHIGSTTSFGPSFEQTTRDIRPFDQSPIPPGGRETEMSGKTTAAGFYSQMSAGSAGPSPVPGQMEITKGKPKPGRGTPSPLPPTSSFDNRKKQTSKPRVVPPLDNQDPVHVAGYTYAGQSSLSKAPRRSTRVAENFVASVATSQFTKKVENRVQPLQLHPGAGPLDFVAAKGQPDAREVLPDAETLQGLLETTFTLSVLEGEETYLRSLHRGGDKKGPVDSDEKRITKAAAKNVKAKVAKKAKSSSPTEGVAPDSEGASPEKDAAANKEFGETAEGVTLEETRVPGIAQGSLTKKKRNWLDSSPLLPGGGSIATKAGAKKGGEYSMYLVPGTGASKVASKRADPVPEISAMDEYMRGRPMQLEEELPPGVVAAIELAKSIAAANKKAAEEEAARAPKRVPKPIEEQQAPAAPTEEQIRMQKLLNAAQQEEIANEGQTGPDALEDPSAEADPSLEAEANGEDVEAAAVKIQAQARGMADRKKVEAIRTESAEKTAQEASEKPIESGTEEPVQPSVTATEDPAAEKPAADSAEAETDGTDMEAAAVKIQAQARGMADRKKVEAVRTASAEKAAQDENGSPAETASEELVQSAVAEDPAAEKPAADSAEAETDGKDMEAAAVKIQAQARGMADRKKVEAVRTASAEKAAQEGETDRNSEEPAEAKPSSAEAGEPSAVKDEATEKPAGEGEEGTGDNTDMEAAAVKIQAQARGMADRKKVEAVRTASAEKAAAEEGEAAKPAIDTAAAVDKPPEETATASESTENLAEGTNTDTSDGKEVEAAAVKIQAQARGMADRKKVEAIRTESAEKTAQEASEKPAETTSEEPVQSAAAEDPAAEKPAADSAEAETDGKDMEAAAVKIQAQARGMADRKKVEAVRTASADKSAAEAVASDAGEQKSEMVSQQPGAAEEKSAVEDSVAPEPSAISEVVPEDSAEAAAVDEASMIEAGQVSQEDSSNIVAAEPSAADDFDAAVESGVQQSTEEAEAE